MRLKDYLEAYLELYKRIGSNGRENILFGQQDLQRLSKALSLQLAVADNANVTWEFPLLGKPGLDLVVLAGRDALVRAMEANSAEYLASPFREVFAEAYEVEQEKFAYGTEIDLSNGSDDLEPGFYIDHLGNSQLMHAMLNKLVGPERAKQAEEFLAKVPVSWNKYYLGLFPGRLNSPIRFGFTLSKELIREYKNVPEVFAQELSSMGYTDIDMHMLKELFADVYTEFVWDVQFDLLPDGRLGPVLGISYSYNANTTKLNTSFFDSDVSKDLFSHLENMGLVDQRWQLLKDCLFYDFIYAFTDKGLEKLALQCKFNFVKVKWCSKKPKSAKFYLSSIVFPVNGCCMSRRRHQKC